jgi:Zn-finger nucleic acid-binding protein
MILACPTCDSRYDVSGYAPGQELRCRCGTLTTLQAPSDRAGLLACPQCGAGVPPTASTCEFCAAELLVKACPRCMARVFHGHKHCPECGAELELAAAGEPTQMECPRCDAHLRARMVGDIVIDECDHCRGLFLDHVAIKRLILDRKQTRAEVLLGALPRPEFEATVEPGGRMYLKCPTCRVVMNRKLFAAGSGVIVDVCRTHGTFFDAGELPAVIDYVMQGGLDAAEKKKIDRMRAEAQRERYNARIAQIEASRMQSTYDVGRGGGSAGALVDLLSLLFG